MAVILWHIGAVGRGGCARPAVGQWSARLPLSPPPDDALDSGSPPVAGELAAPVALHWSPKSPFVRKVSIVLIECGLADGVEKIRTPVDRRRANRDYMALNPLGTIPALALADGSLLAGSALICEYLLALRPHPKLLPPSGAERFEVLRRETFADGMLDALLFWRQERIRPAAEQSAEIHIAYAAKAAAALDRIDAEAAAFSPFPDLGQIAVGSALAYLDLRFPDLDWRRQRSDLAAWHRRFEDLPSARATRLALD
ncbi:MAG: glutathione S-transferase [Sphingomonas sp.]|nr:glutathione S-transferase [Sphingomonas sp.]|tara:strand:+ start:7231 stop:7998 length:768 start_codon:yes stop_codon:yes gene_type:complete